MITITMLALGEGEIIVVRNPSAQKFSKVQQDAKLLLPTSSLSTNDVDQALYRAVLTNMKNDEISHNARKDNLIVKFGEINFEKVGQKMRTMSRKECASLPDV